MVNKDTLIPILSQKPKDNGFYSLAFTAPNAKLCL